MPSNEVLLFPCEYGIDSLIPSGLLVRDRKLTCSFSRCEEQCVKLRRTPLSTAPRIQSPVESPFSYLHSRV